MCTAPWYFWKLCSLFTNHWFIRCDHFLNTHGTEATIIEVMHQLPFPNLIIVLFLLSAFLFLATTFDSGSYILAANQKKSSASH